MTRSTACFGTPPGETPILKMTPVMASRGWLAQLVDHAVHVEDSERLDDGARQRFLRCRRIGGGLERGHEVRDRPPPVAQLDEPVHERAHLDSLRTVRGAQDVAPGERAFG